MQNDIKSDILILSTNKVAALLLLQKESDRCQQGVFTYDNALSVQAYI